MATQQQKRKAAAQTGLYLLIVAAILVVANVLSAGVYERIDVTKTERHTLSEGSKRLIRSLKGPIQVDAYIKRGLPQLDVFVEDLTMLLKQYERVAGLRAGADDFITKPVQDIALLSRVRSLTRFKQMTDELRERAKEAGLQEIPFAAATGEDQAAIAQGYMGLVFKYGSEKGVIPQVMPQFLDVTVYRWEYNFRASTVMGMVGAGGIGLELMSSLRLMNYTEVAAILIVA